ncbi:MAG: Ig-like domain-containing protein, partial [Prevotellaceae bacterium]|nr:Ig-like domain-containing protein [Prevotellaceae bacterium]
MKKNSLYGLPIVLGIIAAVYSCASIGRLEGGPIDETPPRFLSSTPQPNSVNNQRANIAIAFDEYIKLDKPSEKIIISPPQVAQPDVRASGKRVIVNLKDTLKPNTTYTIDFGDAIQDNNEGNPLGDFSFVFSTGPVIDSMVISGTVLNAADLEPIKGIQVGLYSNLSDTAFTTLPLERAGRTDSRGRYSIRGVAPGRQYRIYALQDADQNYYFNQPAEAIAFYDSLIIPSMEQRTRMDTIWKDTLTIDTIVPKQYTYYLPDDILLRAFKERVLTQRLARSERLEAHKFALYFTAPADTLPTLRGLNFDATNAFVTEFPTGRIDTIDYWIKDSLIYQIDTLQMSLTYLHTDSLKQLVPRTDTLRLALRKTRGSNAKEKETPKKKKDAAADTLPPPTVFLPVEVYAPSVMDIFDYLTLSFQEPIARYDTAAIALQQKVDTLWQPVAFTFEQDSIDIKRYNLFADWQPATSYKFTVDSTAFHGLYGLFTDRINQEFTIKKLDEYGQIFFNVAGVDATAFVQLVDGTDKVVRTVPLTAARADFYFLPPGKYSARIILDTNHNGRWDTGNYANKTQPETVYYYPQVLDLKANFDLTQDWNVTSRPADKQKPDELKKQ